MSAQTITPATALQQPSTSRGTGQYTLPQIIGIWTLVTLPLALLAWVAAPALITHWLLMLLLRGLQGIFWLISVLS